MNAELKCVEVQSVTYHENRTRTVEVTCPHCALPHSHSWPVDEADIGPRQGACGRAYDVSVPLWALDPRYRHGYAKFAHSQPHSITPVDTDRGDNAMHEYVNNFEE